VKPPASLIELVLWLAPFILVTGHRAVDLRRRPWAAAVGLTTVGAGVAASLRKVRKTKSQLAERCSLNRLRSV
jgi:hypothetical protein